MNGAEWLEDKSREAYDKGQNIKGLIYEIIYIMPLLIIFMPVLAFYYISNSLKMLFFRRPYNELLEETAIRIYYTQGGGEEELEAEEEMQMFGGMRPKWEDLAEWQRDDRRWQAKAVLDYLGIYKK